MVFSINYLFCFMALCVNWSLTKRSSSTLTIKISLSWAQLWYPIDLHTNRRWIIHLCKSTLEYKESLMSGNPSMEINRLFVWKYNISTIYWQNSLQQRSTYHFFPNNRFNVSHANGYWTPYWIHYLRFSKTDIGTLKMFNVFVDIRDYWHIDIG